MVNKLERKKGGEGEQGEEWLGEAKEEVVLVNDQPNLLEGLEKLGNCGIILTMENCDVIHVS